MPRSEGPNWFRGLGRAAWYPKNAEPQTLISQKFWICGFIAGSKPVTSQRLREPSLTGDDKDDDDDRAT